MCVCVCVCVCECVCVEKKKRKKEKERRKEREENKKKIERLCGVQRKSGKESFLSGARTVQNRRNFKIITIFF